MIYTVTFNPALDYTLTLSELQAGDINRAQSDAITCGGKGINVSVVLTRLGVKNKALGFLAGFTGRELERLLADEGVGSDFVYLKNGNTRINVKLRADSLYDINTNGPEIDESAVNALMDKLSELSTGDTLVLAGSVPSSMPSDTYEQILSRLEGKGVRFVVDATGELLRSVLRFKPFLIKPNHLELGELFGVEISGVEDIVLYSKKLQELGARNVLVSRGEDGAVLVSEDEQVFTTGNIPGELKGDVGCGDSMVAGFLAGYDSTNDYAYALKSGTACGSATAFCDGLATKEMIDKLLESEYLK